MKKEKNKGGGFITFVSYIFGAFCGYVMFSVMDMNIFVSIFGFFIISFIIDVYFTRQSVQKAIQNTMIYQEENVALEEEFKTVCGFPIQKYDKENIHRMIELLESGEADTFKEAANITRSIDQHNKLLEENRMLNERLASTEKSLSKQETEFKKMKKQNKNLKNKMSHFESEIDDLESDNYRY